MSNSIWKTSDQKPEPNRTIIVKIAQTTFCIDYTTVKGMEILPNFEKWCYLDDLIAQADKAERLQKAVDFLSGHLRDVLQLDEYGHIKLDEITKQQIKTAISDPVGIITQLEQESNN